MSTPRTPSTTSGFYGSRSRSSSRSVAREVLQQCVQDALAKKRSTRTRSPHVTPARSQTSIPRRNTNSSYGPGVFLEEIRAEVDNSLSASEEGEPDFDFGDSRRGLQQFEGSPLLSHDHERSQSPEVPLSNPATAFETRRADGYTGRNSHYTDNRINEVIPMLQTQQMILKKVLDSQKAIEERQSNMEEKLAGLQTQIEKPPDTSPTSSDNGRRRRLVPRALSVSN